MIIYIASIAYLRHIVRCTPEGLHTFDLASCLLVALIGFLDKGFGNQRLAAAAHCFVSALDVKFLDPKEPEAARRHLVGTQTLFRFQLLLHILDACFCTVMFMVGAMVVEDIVCEFGFPRMRILKLVLRRALCAVCQTMGHNFSTFVDFVYAKVASVNCLGCIAIGASKLRNTIGSAEA